MRLDCLQVHVMRDHPAHTASMMGGMWGAKVEAVRTDLRQSFAAMFKVRRINVTRLYNRIHNLRLEIMKYLKLTKYRQGQIQIC